MANDTWASLTEVKNFFGYTDVKKFRQEWMELSGKDQAEIRELLFAELHPELIIRK